MISQLRARVQEAGLTILTADEFNQLQREWITRTGAEDMVAAERAKGADLADEYNRLIRHMDAGGSFSEFQIAEANRRFGQQPNAEFSGRPKAGPLE